MKRKILKFLFHLQKCFIFKRKSYWNFSKLLKAHFERLVFTQLLQMFLALIKRAIKVKTISREVTDDFEIFALANH